MSHREKGDYWVICMRCNFKHGNHQIQKEHDTGLMVCSTCIYQPEPTFQNLNPPAEDFDLPFVRIPRPIDPPCSQSSIVGVGIVGCMVVGYPSNPWYDT